MLMITMLNCSAINDEAHHVILDPVSLIKSYSQNFIW